MPKPDDRDITIRQYEKDVEQLEWFIKHGEKTAGQVSFDNIQHGFEHCNRVLESVRQLESKLNYAQYQNAIFKKTIKRLRKKLKTL